MRPGLSLLKEVMSELNPETVVEISTVIGELVDDGMTCVLVTHEMRFAEGISDEVFFTEGGVIVEYGAPFAIFGSPGNERIRLFLRCARADDRRATRKRAQLRRRRSVINLKQISL